MAVLTVQRKPHHCLTGSQVGHLRKNCIYGQRRTYAGAMTAAVSEKSVKLKCQLDHPITPTMATDDVEVDYGEAKSSSEKKEMDVDSRGQKRYFDGIVSFVEEFLPLRRKVAGWSGKGKKCASSSLLSVTNQNPFNILAENDPRSTPVDPYD